MKAYFLYHAPKREFLPTTFFQFKTGLVLFFMAWLTGAFGQTVMKYVPANADVAITFNLQNLEKKVNLDQLKQYDFYQAVVKEFTQTSEVEGREHEKNYYEELLREPTNLGFDLMEPFYFFIKKEGNNTHLTLVMKLSDTAKFETGLQNLKQESYFAYLEEKEGYHLWQQDKQIFAWNDEVVLFVWTEALPDPSYDPGLEIPPYEESEGYEDIAIEEPVEILEEDTIPHPEEPVEIMEVPAIEEEMAEETLPPAEDSLFFDWSMDTLATDWSFFEKNVAAAEWADKVMKRSFLQPLSANQRYLSAISQPADVHLWMDYSFFIESMKSGNPGIAAMGMANEYAQAMNMMTGFLEVLYPDAYLSLDLNFEKGKMAMRSSMYFNEDMKKFYQGMFDVKFNKKLLRYVKGSDQLFGYFYVHYNIEKTIAEGKNLLYKLFDATPQYGEMAADAMQILGIIIDEEAIGEVMKGDLLVSISGLQTVEVTTQTYEFDAEFNYVEKDTTMMKTLPVMTVLASYGSEKDVRKFINLGLHSKVLAAEGRHYKMTVPETGMDFYLALQDGVLILTNNRYLVHQNLEKGFDKKLRLDKKHRKLLCDNASVLYWDIPNTMRALAGDQAGSNAGAMGYMNSLGKEFESFLMTTAKKPENSLRGQMDFNFVKKDVNALQQFFNFVNDIYLEYIGGAKI